MQDRYACDIGDFGKLGLLRFLFSETDFRLGVNWYLVPDEEGNADGMKIEYLLDINDKNERFKDCDSDDLYKKLQQIVKPEMEDRKIVSKGKRAVSEFEKNKILSNATIFYSEKLDFDKAKATGRNFEVERNQWVKKGFGQLKDCDVVFFDPDNGFPPYNDKKREFSTKKNQKKSGKYVYYDELKDYWYEGKGRSLIIYQHRTMEPADKYLRRFESIKDYIPQAQNIFYVRWHPISVRDYIFVLKPFHRKKLCERLNEMFKPNCKWSKLFSLHRIEDC